MHHGDYYGVFHSRVHIFGCASIVDLTSLHCVCSVCVRSSSSGTTVTKSVCVCACVWCVYVWCDDDFVSQMSLMCDDNFVSRTELPTLHYDSRDRLLPISLHVIEIDVATTGRHATTYCCFFAQPAKIKKHRHPPSLSCKHQEPPDRSCETRPSLLPESFAPSAATSLLTEWPVSHCSAD